MIALIYFQLSIMSRKINMYDYYNPKQRSYLNWTIGKPTSKLEEEHRLKVIKWS